MYEYIFGIDKGVPIDIGVDFGYIIITRLLSQAYFFLKAIDPYYYVSTTVLNDIYIYIYIYIIYM